LEREASAHEHLTEFLYIFRGTFFEDLVEFIHRLRKAFLALVVASIIVSLFPYELEFSYFSYTPLVSVALRKAQEALLPDGVKVIAGGWMDVLTVYLIVSLALGFIASSPVIAYEIYAFLEPALYPGEKRFTKAFIVSFTALFALGIVYAYYLIVPLSFKVVVWLAEKSGAEPLFTLRDFVYFVFLGGVASGLFFNLPLILVSLVKLGLLDSESLRRRWREVLVGVLIFTAIITPDPTPISMLLLSIPFIALYGLAVVVSKRIERS